METRANSDYLSPNFVIHPKLIIDGSVLEFSLLGREDQVKMLVRELFYHYSGNFLFGDVFLYDGPRVNSNDADCKSVNTLMNQRFVEYSITAQLKNTADIATILWCLGKTTGVFLSADQVMQNGRDHVRHYPSASHGGLRSAIDSLETSAKLAISRQDVPFEFKYTNFKHLQADDISKSFWTDSELAQEKQAILEREKEILALSWKGWSVRLFHKESAEKNKQAAKYCPPCQIL